MVRETPELFARSCHGCVIAVDGVVMYVEGGGGGGRCDGGEAPIENQTVKK